MGFLLLRVVAPLELTVEALEQVDVDVHVQLQAEREGLVDDLNGVLKLVVEDKSTDKNVEEHLIGTELGLNNLIVDLKHLAHVLGLDSCLKKTSVDNESNTKSLPLDLSEETKGLGVLTELGVYLDKNREGYV